MTWVDGKIARVTVYPDLDEARAAAEQLAKERAGRGRLGTNAKM
jgi:hypothetical protein